jgi:DNA-binding CsgD family transcriptional regulator
VAAFLVSPSGRILDIDERSAAFLRSGGLLAIRHNQIRATHPAFNDLLTKAIERTSQGSKAETLICHGNTPGQTRYTLLLEPSLHGAKPLSGQLQNVACLVFPLGRRRIASARQLMSMFGLSAAEARLARALCHGETLEEFALAQGVKLPTVKTQLRAVFGKTQTDRQVTLVALIAGIPPLR